MAAAVGPEFAARKAIGAVVVLGSGMGEVKDSDLAPGSGLVVVGEESWGAAGGSAAGLGQGGGAAGAAGGEGGGLGGEGCEVVGGEGGGGLGGVSMYVCVCVCMDWEGEGGDYLDGVVDDLFAWFGQKGNERGEGRGYVPATRPSISLRSWRSFRILAAAAGWC